MVRRDALRADATVTPSIVIPGRVLKVVVRSRVCGMGTFWNVHNFGLDSDSMHTINSELQKDIREARALPTARSLIVAGDWNFVAPGETQCSLAAPKLKKINADAIVPSRPHQRTWQKLLDDLTKLQQHGWTHYVPGSMTCARLDRIYTATPSWHLVCSRWAGNVAKDPRATHEAGLNDHSLVTVATRATPPVP